MDDDRYIPDGGGDRYIPDGGGDPYAVRDDDPYADARPMNDTDRFNRNPFDDRMRQTPSPSGQLHLDEFFFLHQLFSRFIFHKNNFILF